MNVKLITALGIATVAMVLAVFVAQEGDDDAMSDDQQLVFPGLAAKLQDLDQAVITSVDASVTLVRGEEGWLVTERAGFPADFDKLSELLRGMAAARFLEQKTARAENHALLGLSGFDDRASEAVLVEVSGGPDKYKLLFGNESEAGQGIFARSPDEDQVWLVTSQTRPQASPAAWIRTVVLNVDAEHVTSVRHVTSAGELLVTRDSESGDFVVDSLPAGAELQYATVANVLSRALVNLRATDVRQQGEAPFAPTLTATFSLDDGSVIIVTGVEEEGDYWLRIDVTPGAEPAVELDSVLMGKFDFKVAEYTFSQFRKSMADMIANKDEEAEAKN